MLGLLDQNFDSEEFIHRKISEVLPNDAPLLLEKFVITINYHDANLLHKVITGRFVKGTLYFLNKLLLISTPKSKLPQKQLPMDQSVLLLGHVLSRPWILGLLFFPFVPIRSKRFMLGDNHLVVNSSMTPHAKIHRRHITFFLHERSYCS